MNQEEETWARERRDMAGLLKRYGIRDKRILAAMQKTRRHMFIPDLYRHHEEAYGDHPTPIGHGQTISQPYIVAYMIEKLALKPGERVLEIGAGCGYEAAVLAELGMRVYAVEIIADLAEHAREMLDREGYADRVQILCGDGYRGWPEQAPFDAIVGACAPSQAPNALLDQLREGGRAIFPVGESGSQRLVIFRKTEGRIEPMDDLPVRFVPMVNG